MSHEAEVHERDRLTEVSPVVKATMTIQDYVPIFRQLGVELQDHITRHDIGSDELLFPIRLFA